MASLKHDAVETQRLASRLGVTILVLTNQMNAVFVPLNPDLIGFTVPNINLANEFLERFGVLLPAPFSISHHGFFMPTDTPASTSVRALHYYCGFQLVKHRLETVVQVQPNGAVVLDGQPSPLVPLPI